MFPVVSISLGDPRYPAQLAACSGAPRVLYCRGDLDLLVNDFAAVIGSRETTPHSLSVARAIAVILADLGYAVVSGLARGIDTAGHTGILDYGGLTLAVLVDVADGVIYPRENRELADRILSNGGLLVSEHPPGASRSSSFPFKSALFARDRIQAGLSHLVIPVQCGDPSGTLHTVRFAESYGRPVLVPHSASDAAAHPDRYRGVVNLVRSKRAILFEPDSAGLTAAIERL